MMEADKEHAMRVHRFINAFALAGICVMANVLAARAGDTGIRKCQAIWPDPFPSHRSFLLNDPRTGLMLYLESDGRHMAAITHDGRIAWQRNLFDDPRLEIAFPPPPPLPGDPPVSDEKWRQQMHSYVGSLYIDSIGVVSDCETHVIDHEYRSPLSRKHYIRAGSGTHIYYLLDAKTGDFLIDAVN